MSDTKAAAHEYLARGWSPIALCPHDHQGVSKAHAAMCGSPGKAPQTGWKEFQTRRPTTAEIEEIWNRFPSCNVGVCMGPVSGIVGLDIDGEAGEALLNQACEEELPDTCEFTTPGGGRRLLFQIPAGVQCPGPTHRVAGKHAGMSLLSHGSQTVMPPSRHASGGVYEWKQHCSPADRPMQPMPQWLIDWAIKQNQKRLAASTQPHTAGEVYGEGARDNALTRLAGSMRRHGAEKAEILAALLVVNQQRCQPPLDEAQVEKIADSVSRYVPAQVNPNRMPSPKPKPEMIEVKADAITPRQIEWLWQAWLPLGKLIVLDGDPGLGKSTMLLDLAARVSRGDTMPDGSPGRQGKVILATAEDGLEDTLTPRLQAANADRSQIIVFKEVKEGEETRPMTLPDDIPLIQQRIRASGVTFVIIDPLVAFLNSSVDSCKDQDVRRCLHRLAVVAEQENCAILFLRHLNKASSGKAIYRGGGSIGIIGAVRIGMLVVKDPDDEDTRILVCTKNNLAEMPESRTFHLVLTHYNVCRVEWSGKSKEKADELLAAPTTPEEKEEKKDALEFVRSFLQGGAQTSTSAYKAARSQGLPEKTVRTARRKLGATVIRIGFGPDQKTYWQLPGTPGPSDTQAA